MYYEDPPRKKRAQKRRGCLSGLIRLVFIGLILWALVMLASGQLINFSLFAGAPEALSANAKLPTGYTNILLLGCDEDKDAGGSRSDSIIVASIGSGGELKLTSIMRDTMLEMGDQGIHKMNAAYRLGGANLAMRTVNKAFALNISKYAAIDFQGFAKLIDAVGGIELTITEAEMNSINEGLKNAYRKKRVFNGVLMTPLTEHGKNIHMSGTHALFYSRIRYIDSDYKRAERQRTVIDTLLKKVRGSNNPLRLFSFAQAALECIDTNLTLPELTALGARVLTSSSELKQFRLPANGTYEESMEGGVWSIRPDLAKNRELLFEFIYR